MRKYTVLIVDDEKLARDSIKVLLQAADEWEIVGEAIDGREAIQLIDQLKPDLIFLDIDMPLVKGMDVLKRLTHKPHTVFTTAYDSFAIKAFEENAVDYLLKPYTDSRFHKALARVKLKIQEQESAQKVESIIQLLHAEGKQVTAEVKKISIHVNDRILLLDVKEILWVSASGNYVELFTATTKYLHYESMGNMEQILNDPDFIRIHRSHLVRGSEIHSLRKHTNGEYFVMLKTNVELKVSRSNRDRVKKIIGRAP